MKLQGVVANFIAVKRFGFINYSAGEIFFHELDVIDGGILSRGDKVEFEIGEFKGRQKAVAVKRISAAPATDGGAK